MGIDYEGGMVVGEVGSELDYDKLSELSEVEDDPGYFLVEEKGMENMSLWFDADFENTIYGFAVADIEVEKLDQAWIDDIKEKARVFKEITGVKARLIGTQNIY